MRIELWGTIIKTQNDNNKRLVDNISKSFQTIKNEVATMGSIWHGDDYDLFYKGMTNYISQIDLFIKDLDKYNEFIDTYLSLHIKVNDTYSHKTINLK